MKGAEYPQRMKIVGILGSPSVASRSGSLLQFGAVLPAEALLHAQFDHPLMELAFAI